MPNLPESAVWDAGVYQVETEDPVQGGPLGLTNKPLKNLANRTAYLKQHVDALEQALGSSSGLDSPHFTGTPTTPDAAWGDYSDQIANTQFVQDAIGGVLSKNIAGQGNFILSQAEAGRAVILLSGVLTGAANVIVPTAPYTREWLIVNRTSGAFAVTVKTQGGTGVTIAQGKQGSVTVIGGNVVRCETDFESIVLGASVLGVTQAMGVDDQRLATTQWVNKRGLKYSPGRIVQGNVAVAANEVGGIFYVGTGGATVTLPKLADTKPGETLTFQMLEDTYSIFQKDPGDGATPMRAGGNVYNSINVKRGCFLTFTNILGLWWGIGGDAGLPFTKGSWGSWGTNGYMSNNNGQLENWGATGTLSPGQTAAVTFAMAYPLTVAIPLLQCISSGAASACVVPGTISLTGFTLRNDGPTAAGVFWRVLGN